MQAIVRYLNANYLYWELQTNSLYFFFIYFLSIVFFNTAQNINLYYLAMDSEVYSDLEGERDVRIISLINWINWFELEQYNIFIVTITATPEEPRSSEEREFKNED